MTLLERLRITAACDYRPVILKNALLDEWWDPLRENFFEGIVSLIIVLVSPIALIWTILWWAVVPWLVAIQRARYPDSLLKDVRLMAWRARRF